MNKYRNYSEDWLESSDTYGEHVSAMTGEKLHSKSDIAAELAWRDDLLAKANERVERYKSAIDEECILWDFTVDDKNPKKSIQLLLDITDAVARDTDVNSKARKFAIENQIKGAADYTAYCQYAPTDSNRKEWAKQLRKEQECEQ